MNRVPVKWDHFNGGEIHSFTDGELRDLLNSDIRGFRARMGVMCQRNGWAHATRTELVGDSIIFQLCISTDGVKPHLPRLPGRHPGRQGARGRHRDCDHENTKLGRERCRHAQDPEARPVRHRQQKKRRARLAEEQAAQQAAQKMGQTLTGWLPGLRKMERAVLIDPDGDWVRVQKEAIYQREMIRRREARERIHAKWGPPTGNWDPAKFRGGPSARQLAYYLLLRMRNDRQYKGFYRFTMDWVQSHYPHLLRAYPDLVHDSLQLLTLKGKIKWL